MADNDKTPDLKAGVKLGDIPASGLLAGKVDDEDVLLVRGASGLFAIEANCSHLGAPLAEGIVTGDLVRCPWHHACFHARTGEAVAAPAFTSLQRWEAHERDGTIRVTTPSREQPVPEHASGTDPVVIIGGGAGGYATADALVRLGYGGPIIMLSSDREPPYDRTLLSKDYLEGGASDDGLAIEGEDLKERGIDVRLGVSAVAIDCAGKTVELTDGAIVPYGKLVLATGAEPKPLNVPGAELPHVLMLRSAADARALLARATEAKHMTVIGSSFIGMEVAASLKTRGLDITVVSPDEQPFLKQFGPELSDAIMAVHRSKGVKFHLGRTVDRIEPDHLVLDDGSMIAADLVMVGIGVSPRLALAEKAGLVIDDGVAVDEHLRTSDPAIYAVGDIARWPDPHSGRRIRVEHWNVALRHGQAVALDIVGQERPFAAVPFFWTKHFDFSVRFLGHAEDWDQAAVEGDVRAKDAEVILSKGGKPLALLTVERDVASLEREAEMEAATGSSPLLLPALG